MFTKIAGSVVLASLITGGFAATAHADYAKCQYTKAVSKVCPSGGTGSNSGLSTSTEPFRLQPAPLHNPAPKVPGKYTYSLHHDSTGWHVVKTPKPAPSSSSRSGSTPSTM